MVNSVSKIGEIQDDIAITNMGAMVRTAMTGENDQFRISDDESRI